MVRIRAHEINVIAVLQDIKKTEKIFKSGKKSQEEFIQRNSRSDLRPC